MKITGLPKLPTVILFHPGGNETSETDLAIEKLAKTLPRHFSYELLSDI